MIRVALSCSDVSTRVNLRNAFNRCMHERHLENVGIMAFGSLADAAESIEAKRRGFIDYVLCGDEVVAGPDAPARGIPADGLRALRERLPLLGLGIVSGDAANAALAYELDAGFLLLPGAYDAFSAMVGDRIARIARERDERVVVRGAGSVHSVPLGDIQFVEASKRGSVMHLPAGETVLVRGTLQGLFDSLCEVVGETPPGDADEPHIDPQREAGCFFVRAGSSFIVNLDNVRSAGEGSFVFADGETIIIPIRKRKALRNALEAYRSR